MTVVVLHSSGTSCSTWAGRLQLRRLARWWHSFCLRYSVRALGLWQYGWYVVTRVWEISQAYEVVRGSVGSAQCRLDWYKNSDLGSEVGNDTGLNSTMLRLIESVVLLTKSIGIITPLILSIVVMVALRWISYKGQPWDCIVHGFQTRSVSYMGFGVGKRKKGRKKEAVWCICIMCEVQSKHNTFLSTSVYVSARTITTLITTNMLHLSMNLTFSHYIHL